MSDLETKEIKDELLQRLKETNDLIVVLSNGMFEETEEYSNEMLKNVLQLIHRNMVQNLIGIKHYLREEIEPWNL